MSYTSDYLEQRKKRKKETENTTKTTSKSTTSKPASNSYTNDYIAIRAGKSISGKKNEDIGPVRKSLTDNMLPISRNRTSLEDYEKGRLKYLLNYAKELEAAEKADNEGKKERYITAINPYASFVANVHLRYHNGNYDEYLKAQKRHEARRKEREKEEERKWFKEADGNIFQQIGGTIVDAGEELFKGAAEGLEGIGDALLMAGATAQDPNAIMPNDNGAAYYEITGQKEKAEKARKSKEEFDEQLKEDVGKLVAKDIIQSDKVDFGTNEYSVLGEKSSSVVQSAGQLAEQLLANYFVPGSGVFLMGATAYGSEAENALNQGASYNEASMSGVISAAAEILTEKIGGVKFGGKTLTDKIFGKFASKMTSKLYTTLAKAGKISVDATSEGIEEYLSGYISAAGQKMTYMEDKEIEELYTNDDKLESFIGGLVLGGAFDTTAAVKKGKGYVSGLDKSEQKVVDKLYNDKISKSEKDGKKLTSKEKTKIYDSIVENMDEGNIDIDTIEEVLGGKAYEEYKNLTDKENALKSELDELRGMKSGDMSDIQTTRMNELKGMNLDDTTKRDALKTKLYDEVYGIAKNSRLVESYNEKARRGQAFSVDLEQYDEKEKATYERAMQSGVLNNTNKSHAFVSSIAKIEAAKGITFDFVDNAKLKESGFALEGKTVNGFAQGGKITVNVQSAKSWQSVVGHEISHVLEGTEHYTELRNTLFEYAKKKGEFETRKADLTELYKNIDADIDAELTADLVGDYLFSDKNFIRNLTSNRNLFQKVYDEVKYLCKVATGKEKADIEKVKHEFDKVWKEFSAEGFKKESAKTNYSVSADSQKTDSVYLKIAESGNTEIAQKMVDDAAKNAGYDIKAYHGTGYDFTVFDKSRQGDNYQDWGRLGKGFYFAPTSREAETWAELSKGAKNKVMPVYLRSENMLDSFEALPDNLKDTIPENWDSLTRRLAEKYAYNYIEYMQEFGYNVQEILTAKGYDGINGHTEFVVFDPEQVKSADAVTYDDKGNTIPLSQRFNTANEDIRFSLSESAEETKDLVAVHNLSEEKLLKSLELGGLPMPSIAIARAKEGHSEFGNISLVFNKDTIDPKNKRSNKIYSGDAWTPTYPTIDYKANKEVAQRVSDKYYELSSKVGNDVVNPMYRYIYDVDAVLNRYGGETALLEELYGDAKMKQVYFEVYNDNTSDGYKAWIDNLFKGIEEKKGVRNNKDAFTPSGNRRSFEALHYEHTLENVIKAMKQSGEKGIGTLGKGNIFGASTTEYKSIADVKDASKTLLRNMSQEEYDAIRDGFSHRFFELANSLPIHKDSFTAIDDAANTLIEAVSKFKTKSGMANYIRTECEGWANYSDYVVDDLIQLVEEIRQMPVGYFEAKPQRAVGFDEVTTAIIPDTASAELKQMLTDNGVDFVEYENGNEQARLDVLNSLEDAKFSLSNQGEQLAPVGNYSTPLYETALAPLREEAIRNAETKAAKITDAPIVENAVTDAPIEAPMPSDADAPPEVEYYNMPDTTALDDKALKNIGKSLRKTLSLDSKETKAIQEIVQEYSTSETPDAKKLFKTIKEQFAERVKRIRNGYISDAKWYLKNHGIRLDPVDIAGITDYDKTLKEIKGKILISDDATHIDSVYHELLSAEFPDLFPKFEDGAEIRDTSAQFKKMVEVAKTNTYWYDVDMIDDATIQEAVNIVMNEVRAYKEDQTRLAAEEAAREALDAVAPPKATQIMNGIRGDALLNQSLDNYPIKTVEDRINENIRAAEARLADTKHLRRETMDNFNKQIMELSWEYANLKNKSTKKADNLVNRVMRLEEMQANNDAAYAKRISDLEAKVEKLKSDQYSRAMHKQDKMQGHADWAAQTLGDTTTWRDKKTGLQYSTNTERRNLRDVVRDENGNKDIARADEIYEATMGEYNRNQAAKNRKVAEVKKPFADMKITKAEAVFSHMLGEFRHNPDTTLTGKEINEYYQKHKNKIDTAKVDKIIAESMKAFDDAYVAVNNALRAQGMKEIPYRKGYFPHFTEPKQNFIQKLFNWKTQDTEIPTSIAGLTEGFKPVKSYQSFDKQRHTDKTDYNILKALDTYLEGAYDWAYHLEDIQKRRAIENHIRFTHSEEGIKAAIKEVYADETLDADEAQAKIEQILAEANNPLNNFVQDFMTHTNILTNKKNSYDRTTEQAFNRKIYSTMINVQNRMSANMVLANVRSALTNVIPITQSWAQVSPLRSLQATKDTIANAIKDDGLINKSTFLTNRLREADNLYQTNWDKVLDKAGIMFEVIDNFSSQVVWRSKYNQNLAKGMTESEAIANADQFAENVMAGRSKGNEPTLFNAKSPFVKAFTMFQLEVNNQYGYLFKDVPNDLKAETNHWKLNLAKGYTTAFIGAYVYNALMEQVAGSGAALDPISIIEDLLRDLGLFDDDEEKEADEVAMNLVDNVVEEMPFVGGLFGGGRIPISSALPYGGEYGGGLKGAIEDVTEGNWKNVGKEMMNPLLNIGLPVGGGQLKKTVQGLKMFDTNEDHPIAGSYTDSGDLRFPVDDTFGNRLQAGIFGQWANENARDYIENGRKPLSPEKTQEFIDVDLPIADYWKYQEGLKGLDKNSEKADYINSLDIEDWQKNLLMNNILDRKENVDMSNYDNYNDFEEFDYAQKNPEKYEFFKANGISYKDYASADEDGKRAYSWAFENPEKYTVSKVVAADVVEYRSYTSDIYDLKADKDSSGKTISGSKKEKVVDYINNLDLDYGQKIILYRSLYDSKEDKQNYNADIVEYLNNRDDLTYEERVTIFKELGFTVEGDSVYWD